MGRRKKKRTNTRRRRLYEAKMRGKQNKIMEEAKLADPYTLKGMTMLSVAELEKHNEQMAKKEWRKKILRKKKKNQRNKRKRKKKIDHGWDGFSVIDRKNCLPTLCMVLQDEPSYEMTVTNPRGTLKTL